MDETEFETLADETLVRILDAVDEAIGDTADVDMDGGILTVELEDGRQFVLNKHAPNRELWLSSPVSGATHFGYDDGVWTSTRGNVLLHEMLAEELSEITDIEIDPETLA